MWSAAICGAYNSSLTVASTTCPPGGQVRNHFARSLPKALDPVRNRRGTEARELVLHRGDGQKLVVFWCYVLLLSASAWRETCRARPAGTRSDCQSRNPASLAASPR